jgi:hypothetical protein
MTKLDSAEGANGNGGAGRIESGAAILARELQAVIEDCPQTVLCENFARLS